jgi:phosphoribosylformimino-5-aminoimidazole carboxamide ribotide isomerase
MKLIAGIDLKNGKCVHLTQGELSSSVVHNEEPIQLIKSLEGTSIQRVHLVDIDGVFSGQTELYNLLEQIIKSTSLQIQFGGGIRSLETAEKLLNLGVHYIVIGTSAITDEELLIQLLEKYDDRIIVAADVYQDEVYIEGWESSSSTTISEFLKTLELLNVKTVMITDISNDGTLSGVNEGFIDNIIKSTSMSIILSGGVKSEEDIKLLQAKSLDGIVVGTALNKGLIEV